MLSSLLSYLFSKQSSPVEMENHSDVRSLTDMPLAFLVGVFRSAENVKDLIALQSTCKLFLEIGRSRNVWTDRLDKVYGLKLKTDVHCMDGVLQTLYRDTVNVTEPVRFWGVFTDGGCDKDLLHYWVDNLFVPNHWESFCSEHGENVNCVALLMDDPLECDVQAEEERNFMIHKCRIPASRIFHDANHAIGSMEDTIKRLQGWSRHELVNLMVALVHDMEGGGVWGELLLHGVPANSIQAEKARLREFVHRMENFSNIESDGIVHLPQDSNRDLFPEKSTNTRPRSFLYNTKFLSVAQGQSDSVTVGVIDSVTISRQGIFSCPVLSGMLFVAQIDLKSLAVSHSVMTDALKEICGSEGSTSFDGLDALQDVRAAAAAGTIPAIRHSHSTPFAQWIEFSHDECSSTSPFSVLKPVVWFRFKLKEELQQQQQQQNATVEAPLEDFHELDDADIDFEEDMGSDTENDSEESLVMDDDSDDDDLSLLDDGELQEVAEDLGMAEGGIDNLPDMLQDPHHNILVMPLSQRVSGNVVVLKLIAPEDLMQELGDNHSLPNIDVNHIVLKGKKLSMPQGVHHQH